MSAKSPYIPWEQLSTDQRRCLYWAIQSLDSFAASRQFMIDNQHRMDSSLTRFIVNGQYVQLFSYYQPNRTLRQFLSELGCSDLLTGVAEVLSSPLGAKTFFDVLKLYRNNFLDHASFNPDHIWDWAPRERRIEYASRMSDLLLDLGQDTVVLYESLRRRYPLADHHAP